MADRMCVYGNCDKRAGAVTININGGGRGLGERPAFCCAEHAGLYLLKYAFRIEGMNDAANKLRLASEVDAYLQPVTTHYSGEPVSAADLRKYGTIR